MRVGILLEEPDRGILTERERVEKFLPGQVNYLDGGEVGNLETGSLELLDPDLLEWSLL